MFEYDPSRSRIDQVTFVSVSQVRKKRAMDARVSCCSGCMSTAARASKGPSQRKTIRVNKPEKSIIIGMAIENQQIADQNQWTTVRTGDVAKVQFPCFAKVIETTWYTGECRATSCLSCSATLSKQFLRFHSNYTAKVVFQGQDMHAFFIHHHEQARNVRKSFRRYRSS